MSESTGPFSLQITDGVALATLDRPPVNAFDLDTYRALRDLVIEVEQRADAKVLVLAAREDARCWCGGADLRDFVGMDPARRKERYAFVNDTIPRLLALERPVIAAVTGHAIGIGVLLAAACDLRVASVDAEFSCPEIDYGLVAGSSRLLNYLGVPEALVREMTYTGDRVAAARMHAAGFLNAVVPPASVVPAALDLASRIAAKSLPALQARKRAFVGHEELGWLDAYQLAQALSAELVAMGDGQAGVRAFLDKGTETVSDG